MKRSWLSCLILAVLAAAAGLRATLAQSGNGLLLPFPPAAAVKDSPQAATEAPVSGRSEPGINDRNNQDARRALEIAATFIRRQQMEVANSVPRRGATQRLVPSRTLAPMPAIAARTIEPPHIESAGPSSELLPLPGDEALGAPLETVLPDVAGTLQVAETRVDSTSPGGSDTGEVSRDDLSPVPAYGGVEDQDRRGPVFRVSGAHAYAVARARGFRFTPAGGLGSRDGNHTAASQFPHVLTSEVHSTRMSQLRPPAAWSVAETSNTFFMFCDSNYNAVRLAPGWRIRGIKLEGPLWRWVACPRSGSNTASFSIRIHAYKGQDAATSVQLAGLTLEGPEGATDWKDAFPWINGRGPGVVPAPAVPAESASGTLAAAPDQSGGPPPLPQ